MSVITPGSLKSWLRFRTDACPLSCLLDIVLAECVELCEADHKEVQLMSHTSLKAFSLVVFLLAFAGCAPVQTPEADAPPPAQNLLGSTDELQLVTELSIDLANLYGGDRVLVVLEIDNTLLAVEQDSGCPESALEPSQADAAQQVRRMQNAGLKVIVMTSRGPGCRMQTLRELSRNDFSFQASAWPPQSGYPEPFLPAGGVHPVIYQDGVFLTAGQNKGLMLKALLEKTVDSNPTLIVMVDQKQDDLNAVMKEFSWTGTKVHAWRYTREDSVTSDS
jgi:hypothetical protein